MKKFDLTRALPGNPVITRDGREVNILSASSCDPTHPVVGELPGSHNRAFALRWTKEGVYCKDGYSETEYDLFMAPIKKETWVNVYLKNNSAWTGDKYFECEVEGKKYASTLSHPENYLKTIKIHEWEE